MKVKELIEVLQQLDQEKTIGYYDSVSTEDEGIAIVDNETYGVIVHDLKTDGDRAFHYSIC